MKKLRHLRQESMVPQWLHKMVMAPKMKQLVRAYLNWRKKNPGQGARGVQQAIKMMGLNPRDGNQLIDTLNDLVKQGKLPKHLAIAEEAKYDYGTPESVKLMKKITPGQNEAVQSADKKPEKYVGPDGKTRVRMVPVDKAVVSKEATTAQIRMARRLKKHGVGKHDDFYKSKMDPETRKKYEPAKRPPPAKINKPTGSFKWFATRDMKKDG